MALTEPEKRYVESSIRSVLEEHCLNPFFILREAGVVAELRGRLLTAGSPFGRATGLSFIERVERPDNRRRYDHSGVVNTDVSRVQMEITVNAALAIPEQPWKKTLDIAILSARPQLRVHDNGPGDVVAQVPPGSVAAAFEVKASPSADHKQRGLYVKDILTLLWLRRTHGIPGYFVALDKSQPLYGAHRDVPAQAPMDWRLEGQRITIPSKVIANPSRNGLSAWNLHISDDPTTEESVEVWMIDADGCTVRPRYASFIDPDALGQPGSPHGWLAQLRDD
jgi:hypothetical protein